MQYLAVLFFFALCALALASSQKGARISAAKKSYYSSKGVFPDVINGDESTHREGFKPWPHMNDVMKQKPKNVSVSSYEDRANSSYGPQLNVDYAGKPKGRRK